MEEQSGNGDELRHECKLCRKSFSSGRSLGGHMRSHSTTNSSDPNPSSETTNGCGLREKQRKRKKQGGLDFDEDPSAISQTCEVCGRKFSSCKELLAHAMKSHLVDDIKDSSKEEGEDEEEAGCRDSQSSHNDSGLPNRKKRSKRRKRFGRIKVLNSSFLSTRASEIEQELEDVALCLMMLSRDSSSEADSSDKNSITVFHDDPIPDAVNSRSELSISGKLGSRSGANEDDPDQSRVKADGVSWSPSKRKFSNCPVSGCDRDTEKGRFRFECNTCSKVFQSYQALGGHRAGHRKSKSKSKSTGSTQLEEEEEKKKREGDDHHECPLCLKVFPSGQALGGHKKSHFWPSIMKPKAVDEAREFIDLNLPAPLEDEEEEEESSSNVNFIAGML